MKKRFEENPVQNENLFRLPSMEEEASWFGV
ncbi:hypothetical protein TNCV_4566451, partial [Trichonephila clavipes]